MGTTTHGFPYPEGSDLVISGDDAIEALAVAVDGYATGVDGTLATHYINGRAFGTSGDLVAGQTANCGWAGAVDSVGAFTFNGSDTFTYSGPDRNFVISGGIVVVAGSGFFATLELLIAGNLCARTYQSGGLGLGLSYTFPCRLSAGDTILQRITASATATAQDPYLRVMAV